MLKAAPLAIALLVKASLVGAGEVNLEQLAKKYFEGKLATQQPNASPADLEAYLTLLSENVGYEHKPYRVLGEAEGGRQRMREGMTYYLGKNDRYEAELVSIATGHKAIAIQYKGIHVFRRAGDGPLITKHFNAMDVLEIEAGEVTIIREYRE